MRLHAQRDRIVAKEQKILEIIGAIEVFLAEGVK